MSKGKLLTVIPENRKDYFNCSVSKKKTFKSCKQKYYFTYVQKLKMKKEWDFQIFGTFLHLVLENFENFILAGDKSSDNVIMKNSYNEALKEFSDKLTPEQQVEAKEILNKYLKKRTFLKKEGKLPKIIKAEKEFNILIDEKVLLGGYIDVVREDYDSLVLVSDYKTTKDKKYLKNDFLQLQTYSYALFLEDPNLKKIKTSYILLKHNLDELPKEYDRDQVIECVEKEFLDFFEETKKEKLFRPTKTPLCKFCDYFDVCPAQKSKQNENFFGEVDW